MAAGDSPEIVTIVLVEFALTWLCSYKVSGATQPLWYGCGLPLAASDTSACWLAGLQVLAWACNRGPLARPWSPLQFVAIMLAPITPVEGRLTA